jgi:hypothetical protein
LENDNFIVTVKNRNSELLSGVKIKFLDQELYTDFSGSVTINAPDVNWDKTHEILAIKSGYESSVSEVKIKNNEDFQYLFLIIVIFVVFLIGIIYYINIHKKI